MSEYDPERDGAWPPFPPSKNPEERATFVEHPPRPRFLGFSSKLRGASFTAIAIFVIIYAILSMPKLGILTAVVTGLASQNIGTGVGAYFVFLVCLIAAWLAYSLLILSMHYYSWRIIEEVPEDMKPMFNIWLVLAVSIVPYFGVIGFAVLYGYWAKKYDDFVWYWSLTDAPRFATWVFWAISALALMKLLPSDKDVDLGNLVHVFYYCGVIYAVYMKCKIVDYFADKYPSGGVRQDWDDPRNRYRSMWG